MCLAWETKYARAAKTITRYIKSALKRTLVDVKRYMAYRARSQNTEREGESSRAAEFIEFSKGRAFTAQRSLSFEYSTEGKLAIYTRS